MKHVRSISIGAVVVVVAGAAAASGAVNSASPPPPASSLAAAVRGAFVAPEVDGVTARITFTNKLIDSSGLAGASGGAGSPMLVGGKGRLWLAADGRARIELQSDRGDVQIVSDGRKVTVFDGSSNTAYVATLPKERPGDAGAGGKDAPRSTTPPSLAKISDVLEQVAKVADLGQPEPTTLAGRGAYSVKVAPHDGGLVGKMELAWDAITGVPLRVGVYATGASKPSLELAATDVSFGPVDEAALSVPVPAGAKVETIDVPSDGPGADKPSAAKQARLKAELKARASMTPAEVGARLPFELSAPQTLAGQERRAVRLVGSGDKAGALVTYGTGLGGIAVLQTPVPAASAPTPPSPQRDESSPLSGSITINGSKGTELSTALGTLVRFRRGDVQYTVVGSVTSAVAEAAARGL